MVAGSRLLFKGERAAPVPHYFPWPLPPLPPLSLSALSCWPGAVFWPWLPELPSGSAAAGGVSSAGGGATSSLSWPLPGLPSSEAAAAAGSAGFGDLPCPFGGFTGSGFGALGALDGTGSSVAGGGAGGGSGGATGRGVDTGFSTLTGAGFFVGRRRGACAVCRCRTATRRTASRRGTTRCTASTTVGGVERGRVTSRTGDV